MNYKRYSSWTKFFIVVRKWRSNSRRYVLRRHFRKNKIRKRKTTVEKRKFLPANSINEIDMRTAEIALIKQAQQETFQSEIENIKKVKSVNKSSKLVELNPYIDYDGVMRANKNNN